MFIAFPRDVGVSFNEIAHSIHPDQRESQLRQIYSLYRGIMGYTDNWVGHPTYNLWKRHPTGLANFGKSVADVCGNKRLLDYFSSECGLHHERLTHSSRKKIFPRFITQFEYLHLSRNYLCTDKYRSFYLHYSWGEDYPVLTPLEFKVSYLRFVRANL